MIDILLVDSSTIVNFLRGHSLPSTQYLKNNLSNILIATCPVIIQEVLQGIVHEKDYLNTRSFFDDTIHFIEDQYILAVEAADLYRKLRKQGVIIRKPNDCLIAIYAIKHNVPLLHDNRDFENIARYSDLKIVKFN